MLTPKGPTTCVALQWCGTGGLLGMLGCLAKPERGAQWVSKPHMRSISNWNVVAFLLVVWMTPLCEPKAATGFVLPTEDTAFAWSFTPVALGHTAVWKLHWKQGSRLSIQLENPSLVISVDLNYIKWYLVPELALSCSVQHICLSLCLVEVCMPSSATCPYRGSWVLFNF